MVIAFNYKFVLEFLKITEKMARPIRETPILTGKDAEVFVERMREVENLSEDIREANRAKLQKQCERALRRITICI